MTSSTEKSRRGTDGRGRNKDYERCSPSHPCTHCGKGNERCSRAKDGSCDICYGNPTDGGGVEKQDISGSIYHVYWHAERNGFHHERPKQADRPSPPVADPDTLNRVYSALLGHDALRLSPGHREALRRRGLDDEAIDRHGFRTMPDADRATIAFWVKKAVGKDAFLATPGFYIDDRGRPGVACGNGLLIPVRDPAGRIVGIIARPDDGARATGNGDLPKYHPLSSAKHGGPGPGSVVHVPLGTVPSKRVRITEGAIKAIVAAEFSGVPTIGTPGVSNWRSALDTAEALGAETVVIAVDADWRSNPKVARALHESIRAAREAGLTVELEVWHPELGKGIDDVLTNGGRPTVISGDGVAATLAEIERAAGITPAEPPPDPESIWAKIVEAGGPDRLWSGLTGREDVHKDLGRLADLDPSKVTDIKARAREHFGKAFRGREFDSLYVRHRTARPKAAGNAHGEDDLYIEGDGPEGGTFWMMPTNDGPRMTRIANFTARIVSQQEYHARGDVRRRFVVAAARPDGTVKTVTVDARQYDDMAWVSDLLGGGWFAEAGPRFKDHLRAAIMRFSLKDGIIEEIVYADLGWHEVGGATLYLHAGGAIGADGPSDAVRVEVNPALGRFELPAPAAGPPALHEAVAACLDILTIGFDAEATEERPGAKGIAATMAGIPWRAVLGALGGTVHGRGTTGSLKTSTACLTQQFFAPEHDYRVGPPATWDSTANAVQVLQYEAKDSVLLVDDLVVDGPDGDRVQAKAAAVLSNQGNLKGRQRMRPDGSMAPDLDPRTTLLSTGETDPARRSARGRTLVLPFVPNDDAGAGGSVDPAILKRLQEAGSRGQFALAMASYIRHLARPEELGRARAECKRLAAELRDEAAVHEEAKGAHPRHYGIVAEIAAGFRLFLGWAKSVGAITSEQYKSHIHDQWQGMLSLLGVQAEAQRAADPGLKFIGCLLASLDSKRSYLAAVHTGDVPDGRDVALRAGWYEERKYQGNQAGWCPIWVHGPNARQIGWVDEANVYLDREAAYAAAQEVARAQSDRLADAGPIWARLAELGYVAAQRRRKDDPRVNYTVRATICGMRREVAKIAFQSLWTIQVIKSQNEDTNEPQSDVA